MEPRAQQRLSNLRAEPLAQLQDWGAPASRMERGMRVTLDQLDELVASMH
jgi:hypothetical protein